MLPPLPTLLNRIRAELSGQAGEASANLLDPARPLTTAVAPGRLDVMGGIADYTGALVCQMTLDRAAAVALQARADRQVRIISLDLLDQNRPFTFGIALDALAATNADQLQRELAQPGRRWAGYVIGCLFLLHEQSLLDLHQIPGLNLALHSTVPMGAGVSSSAALEVATMMALLKHFNLQKSLDLMRVATLCQAVENRIVGAPCGIMDQVASLAGQPNALLRLLCQPHELQPPLPLPPGIRCVGINSGVKHDVSGGPYARTRCAAFMGHRLILDQMRALGAASGQVLQRDPTNGYLANLLPEDYKQLFRPALPVQIRGREFLDRHGPTIDPATTIDPDQTYPVRRAADHHVLEAMRCRNFVRFLEEATAHPAPRALSLNKAGHLMYASHIAYSKDADLGAHQCDLLVELIRARESAGLYGARITGGGLGGTVAVLANTGEAADAAMAEVAAEYEKRTGHIAEIFQTGGPGAWFI